MSKFFTRRLFRSNAARQEDVTPEPTSIPQSQLDSRAPSAFNDSLDFIRQGDVRTRQSKRFQSYRLIGPYEQPWLKNKKMRRTRINNLIVYGFTLVGAALAGYICYTKVTSVVKHDYCLILDDHFTSIDPSVWGYEVQTGDYGTGSFDWTTTDPKNAFVDADGLHIQPTLTNESTSITSAQILNGYNLNLTQDGTCTGSGNAACEIASNTTLGTIINPVRSARLNTQGKKSMTYGKVEIIAKLPKGDWLWPAIWMFPETNFYGAWPASGELDIAEARGNAPGYPDGGRDTYTTSIHWGPSVDTDAYWRATAGKSIRRADFSTGYHTFGIEWSKNYIFTYLDFELQQVLYWSFVGTWNMWQRGYFSSQTINGSLIADPWSSSPNLNAPFDRPFYLVMNVAVGSQNGWFPDGIGNKPWVDGGPTSVRDFWNAADEWLPTWGAGTESSMTVKNVKMWQEGDCGLESA